MNTLELAQAGEVEACYHIVDEGREFQRSQGFVQWTDDYPNLDTIRRDVQAGKGYAVKVDGRLAGYLCIDFSGEPDYEQIEGKWRSEQPYAVVHRMAFSGKFRGKGLADSVFALVEKLCADKNVGCIRIDTDFPNKRMQHVLEKNGFVRCGVIQFQGNRRIAYDKLLA